MGCVPTGVGTTRFSGGVLVGGELVLVAAAAAGEFMGTDSFVTFCTLVVLWQPLATEPQEPECGRATGPDRRKNPLRNDKS